MINYTRRVGPFLQLEKKTNNFFKYVAMIFFFSKLCLFYFFSDNGPHYHNSTVLFYLSEVNRVFNFTLKENNNFEGGLDSHFAHIGHKIVWWVYLGNDLVSGEQAAELIQVDK